jgi:hypothetical protein
VAARRDVAGADSAQDGRFGAAGPLRRGAENERCHNAYRSMRRWAAWSGGTVNDPLFRVMRRKGSGPKLVPLRLVPLREARRCVRSIWQARAVAWCSVFGFTLAGRSAIRSACSLGPENTVTTPKHQFAFSIDTWTPVGASIVEQVALVEDYKVALATFRAACERCPNPPSTLRQGARVVEDSRSLRLAWSDKGRQDGRWGALSGPQSTEEIVMKELRQCIRGLRTMQDGPIRDVVLPIIAALEAVNARIAALEAGAPPKDTIDMRGSQPVRRLQ